MIVEKGSRRSVKVKRDRINFYHDITENVSGPSFEENIVYL